MRKDKRWTCHYWGDKSVVCTRLSLPLLSLRRRRHFRLTNSTPHCLTFASLKYFETNLWPFPYVKERKKLVGAYVYLSISLANIVSFWSRCGNGYNRKNVNNPVALRMLIESQQALPVWTRRLLYIFIISDVYRIIIYSFINTSRIRYSFILLWLCIFVSI